MESQSNVNFVLFIFGVYFILSAILIILTAKSNLSRKRKIIVYILTIIGPLIGLILFLIFRFSKKNENQ